MLTYRDRVGIERCAECQAAIRSRTDDPIVAVPIVDLEKLALGLSRIAETLAELVEGLEHVTGRSSAQVQAQIAEAARRAERAEAIPAEIKTDRAGLMDDEADH